MSGALERLTSVDEEPVTIYAAFAELVRVVLPVAVLFGLPLNPEQLAGLVLVVGAAVAFVQVWKTRTKTTPPNTLEAEVEARVLELAPPDEPGKHASSN